MTSTELKEKRKKKKMTQDAFADWLGVKKRTVVAWETGQNPVPEWLEKRLDEDIPVLNPKLSLDVVRGAIAKADEEGISLDEWIAKVIKASLKLLLFFAFCASLLRWAETGDPASAAVMGVVDAATLAGKALWSLGSFGVEMVSGLIS
jgi:hypothetical protein